jgi:hypothetical protein
MAVDQQASDRSARADLNRARATETKHSFKTTEFFAYIFAVLGVLIAAAIVGDEDGGGGGDVFGARSAWLYVTILTVGYVVSRGLSKSGSREPYWDRSDADRRY